MAIWKWREALLETPSGFTLFTIKEDVLNEANDIWVYFRNVSTARQIMIRLGDVQFDDKSVAWDGETEASWDLMRLIRRSCKGRKDLIVQSDELKAVIQEKLKIQCSYEPSVVDELIWGMKHVLHGFISYERNNITKEYCLPLSKGLQQFLQDHLINIKPKMLHNKFISEIGLLRYVDTTLEQVSKTLRESFDEHVCKIGESIGDDLEYARVLANILVPELAPKYDFLKMFPSDLALKIEDAKEHATKYRDEELTMHDMEIIMGGLSHLLAVPKQRNEIMIRVKRMESEMTYHFRKFESANEESIREPANLKDSTYRRTLLETPSGFAIFDVCEDVFKRPQHIWTSFITEMEALGVVLALDFVKVHEKSIVRDNLHGPGQDVSRLIRKLRPHGTKFIVQDDDLKSVIEEKLKVKCCTKLPNDDDGVGDLMWGLKHVLQEFIPQEKDNLTEDYYLPMSKGLQNKLQSYGVSVSQGQMDRQFVFILGYLEHLDWVLSVVPLIFRQSFDRHVSYIGTLIEDHVDYANVVAQILVPESGQKIDVKSLSSVEEDKVAEVAANIKKSGNSVSDPDKKVILAVRGYLTDVRENKDKCLQFLKCNGSEVEVPRVGEAFDDEVNSWLMSLTMPKASLSEELTADGMPIAPCQIGDEGQGDIEGTKTPKKAALEARNIPEAEITGKNKSGEDKSTQAYDSFEKVPNIEELLEPSTGKSVGTDADLLQFMCQSEMPGIVKPQQQLYSIPEVADHLAISQGADSANQHHYPVIAVTRMKEKDMSSGTVLPSQAKVLDMSISATAHEFKIVGRTNFGDMQNGKGGTGGTFDETNERHIIENFEEKQQCKEAIAVPIPDKTNVIFTMDNSRENEQNETEASSCKPFVDPNFSSGIICSIDDVVDNKQSANTFVSTDDRVVCSVNLNDKTYEQYIAVPTSHEFSLVTSDYRDDMNDEQKNGEILLDSTSSTSDDDEDKKQSEETAYHPCTCQNNTQQGTGTIAAPASDETEVAGTGTIAAPASDETEAAISFKGRMEHTAAKAINKDQSEDEIKVANVFNECRMGGTTLNDYSEHGSNGAGESEVTSGKNKSGEDKSTQAYDSFEEVPDIEELLEPSTGESVGKDADLLKFMCHSETPCIVKPQQQLYSIPEVADHLAISQGADNANQHHYPVTAVTRMKEKDMSSGTVLPSQAKVLDMSISATAHEVKIVSRTNFGDMQNGKGGTGGTFDETNEKHIIENFEEKQQCKEAIAVPIPDKTNVIFTMDNSQENEQNETEASSCKPFADPTFSSGIICRIDDVVDNKQSANTLVSTDDRVVCSTDLNDKTYEQYIAVPTSCEFSFVTSDYRADMNDEQKNREILSDPTSSTSDDEDKKQSEETASHPSSCQNNTQQGTGTIAAPASDETEMAGTGTIAAPASDETEAAISFKGRMEDTAAKGINKDQSEDEIKVANVFNEGRMGGTTLNENSEHGSKGAGESEVTSGRKQNSEHDSKGADESEVTSGRTRITLQDLLNQENNDTKKKQGIKNWLLSFRRRSSKDNLFSSRDNFSVSSKGSPSLLPSIQSDNVSASSSTQSKAAGLKYNRFMSIISKRGNRNR